MGIFVFNICFSRTQTRAETHSEKKKENGETNERTKKNIINRTLQAEPAREGQIKREESLHTRRESKIKKK